jgi:hypothetical protein
MRSPDQNDDWWWKPKVPPTSTNTPSISSTNTQFWERHSDNQVMKNMQISS